MHTAEGSACARVRAADQVVQYKENGYDGILVTDHFVTGNSAVDRTLPWEQQMRMQFSGYDNALKAGKDCGLKVFCGIEFAYKATEFILVGPDADWFIAHPDIVRMEPKEFLKFFNEEGFAIIQAHPFREASYISEIRLFPEESHAIETMNLGNYEERFDTKARELALKYNKPQTYGSDCHAIGRLGAGIELENEPEDEYDLKEIIRSGRGWEPFNFGKANYEL